MRGRNASRLGGRRARQHRRHHGGQRSGEFELHRGSGGNCRSAIDRCGIRTIVTSKVFLAKAKIAPFEGMVYLEDILAAIGKWAKLKALWPRRLAPAFTLSHGRARRIPPRPSSFPAAARARPKGVMLSHYNLISNMESVAQLFRLGENRPHHRVAAVLPFVRIRRDHLASLDRRVAAWPIIQTPPTPKPSESWWRSTRRRSSSALRRSTPPMCANARPKEFRKLEISPSPGPRNCGSSSADAFREKFGIELLEGYGCTEMSPVVIGQQPGSMSTAKKSRSARSPVRSASRSPAWRLASWTR